MNCKTCNKQIVENRKYCSKSCAAITNNKVPKRKRLRLCVCGNGVKSNYKFCEACVIDGKHLRGGVPLHNKTIKEACTRVGANKFDNIRKHSLRAAKPLGRSCQKCGYSKHVEVCHKTPISKFPDSTLISVVNNINNLLVLCPNCHWEFDNVVGVGFEPTTTS